MTETTAVSHGTPYHRPKTGSFGVPIPGVRAAMIGVDGYEFFPVGEVGELILYGPISCRATGRREAETEAFVEIDGQRWLRTGDLVRMDEEGYFYFFDRKRDLIKHKGYSVFARHVEEVLYGHPQVKAAGVVGVPGFQSGEFHQGVCCFAKRSPGESLRGRNHRFLPPRIWLHYKVPGIVEFRGELPKRMSARSQGVS